MPKLACRSRRVSLEAELDQRTADLETQLGRLDAKIDRRTAELRAEFHKEIGSVKAELLKWNVALWVPVVLALIGLYFKP